ncbi:restriction endonuclease subunit S [Streptomyces bobili]|uniref:restriction endonuclease subunit S n=1 Tax=Streptomyces bobili TaxID=67280 RepID=UPI003712DBE5
MTFPTTKLKWVATTTAGGTPSVAEPSFWSDDGEEGLPWVSIGDMSGRAWVTTTGRRVSKAGVAAARLPVGDPGTLLLSMYASLGHTAFLTTRATWNQAILGINASPSHEVRFIKYALEAIKPTLMEFARSNTQANLNAEQVGNLVLPEPPLDRQRRIADFLDAEVTRIDALHRARTKQISALDERLEAVRDSLFCESPNSTSTPLMYLTDPFRPIVYGIVQAGPEFPGGVPYIKTGDLKNLHPESLSKTSPEIHNQFRRAAVHPGDIVMAMRASIGAVAIVPPELPESNLTQGTARIAACDGVNNEWLFQALQTRRVREQCDLRAVGSTFRTLNIWDLRRVTIIATSHHEQAKFVTQFRAVEAQHLSLRAAAQRQITLLAERRQALITAAVTGQFDVSTASGRNVTEGVAV